MNDLIILASLLMGPRHGYEIKKAAGLILGEGELHNNQVYPALHRFERAGWVARKRAPGERGQTRLQYRLTPKGRAAMVQRLSDFSDEGFRGDDEFFLRVGLLRLLAPATRRRLFDARTQQLTREREHFEDILKAFRPPRTIGGEVLGFLARRAEFELDWVKRLRRLGTEKGAAISRRLLC